jgi:hypothetical protein
MKEAGEIVTNATVPSCLNGACFRYKIIHRCEKIRDVYSDENI